VVGFSMPGSRSMPGSVGSAGARANETSAASVPTPGPKAV
jgi:hypothetical protein